MIKHDYEKEILDILAANQNCIIGFNNLRKLGKGKGFNPNFLKVYLQKMESEGIIIIEKIGNKSKICRVDQDLERKIKIFLNNTKKLEAQVFKKINKDESFGKILEYLFVMLEKHRELILGELFATCVIPNKYKLQEIQKVKKRIQELMVEKFGRLEDRDKERMLDRLLNRY